LFKKFICPLIIFYVIIIIRLFYFPHAKISVFAIAKAVIIQPSQNYWFGFFIYRISPPALAVFRLSKRVN
jgi:hypothetical protein